LEEIWKPVPNYEGFYEVSNLGRFRSLDGYRKCRAGKLAKKKGQIIKQGKYPNGYMQVHFKVNGIDKCFLSHRIVADVFVENDNPKLKTIVNHIDGNKYNNNISNLEWVTYSENQKHAYKNGLNSWNETKGKKPKGVIQLEKDTGKEIARYKSIGEALRAINAPQSHTSLVNCCNKKKHYNTFHGYKWEWIENMLGEESEE
jgi:hypothetical protein